MKLGSLTAPTNATVPNAFDKPIEKTPAKAGDKALNVAVAKTYAQTSAQVSVQAGARAAQQEATETKAQTNREAEAGDAQARRLIAKEGDKTPPAPSGKVGGRVNVIA